ncbi:DUF4175 family protein [Coralloluteibacterium stylophorae]|uniref:DUF4175 domain-containing protein n=1 Tax=Coralloluteibacterium stylophorae TaxID=1776034 RepID=A0AAP2FZ12_9GAMM|nr:DUF4175 family protein [Coralloluteibacterium stylophorae]MBS7457487.1 hypothetical protein [Coralloluteibacterium stylophorae]
MTHGQLERLRDGVRRRETAVLVLVALPLVAGLTALALRGGAWGWAVAGAGLVVLALGIVRARRRLDLARTARLLDAADPGFDDSAGLLCTDPASLNPLQRLQRERLQARLAARADALDLRPAWPWRWIGAAWLAGGLLLAAGLWPGALSEALPLRRDDAAAPVAGDARTRLVAATIAVRPPEYTGLPPREDAGLDSTGPAGTRFAWTLTLAPRPARATLVFIDGERLPLERDGEVWRAELAPAASTLYRLEVEGAPPDDARLHRIDIVDDRPPEIRLRVPDRNLVLAEPDQQRWALEFEASDDYGIGAARLRLTRAQGTGEVIEVSETVVELEGEGDARQRRYAHEIDLDALGVGPGTDLVARLEVADNRVPGPQTARSAAVILRWPPPTAGETGAMEGLVQRTLPAYFRSQRQIIIDAEALIAERAALAAETFVTRSDAIGVDQRLLRLRYGQFLGEEAEGGAGGHGHGAGRARPAAAPEPEPEPAARPAANMALFADSDAHLDDAAPAVAADSTEGAEDGQERAGTFGYGDSHPYAHAHDHDHDHDGTQTDTNEDAAAHDHAGHGVQAADDALFGDGSAVVAEFGHTHDHAEAATLLDPETKEILRAALREMWQSELHLRQGEPDAALPFAHRALELVKKVQQADRIYLARVGLELPPIDPERRLTGEVEPRPARTDTLAPAVTGQEALLALWRALDAGAGAPPPAALEAAQAWTMAHRDELSDPLGLLAAIDTVRAEADCEDCRARLQAALWRELPEAVPAPPARPVVDAAGGRYLQALQAPATEDAP